MRSRHKRERSITKVLTCLLINAVRDVMYGVSRLSSKGCNIVISENVTCSLGLKGVTRVDPWNIKEVSDALRYVLKYPRSKTSEDHKRNLDYVKMQDMDYIFLRLMDNVLEQCKEHESKTGHGFGVASLLRIEFFLLDVDEIVPLEADLALRLASILSHLKTVFLGDPVMQVEHDKGVLEFKPEYMNKMAAAQRIILDMIADGMAPDFVLSIGSDAYKENLIDCCQRSMPLSSIQATVHKIGFGLAPHKPGCYIDDSEELVDEVLASLCTCLI